MVDLNLWLSQAKKEASALNCGMYLIHNGVVRQTSKKQVREGIPGPPVSRLEFSFNAARVSEAIEKAKAMPGIYYVNVWLGEGILSPGDDLMVILVGGDIRPHVMDCMNQLLDEIKGKCVIETEIE